MDISTKFVDRHHLPLCIDDGTMRIAITLNVRDARRLATEISMAAAEVQRRNKNYRRSADRQYDLPLNQPTPKKQQNDYASNNDD